MNSICIIPARGGSKRIPGKNIKEFCGKPIISYSIEKAISSRLFQSVIVSTDCPRIANISNEIGASVPFLRSSKNSSDTATTSEVITEVIKTLKFNSSDSPKYICCFYPTSPLIPMEYLIQGYNKIITNKYDAIYPVCQFNYPIQRAFHLNSDCILKYREKNHTLSRSQDLEEFYHDTGTWYWMKTSSFIKSNSIFGEKTYGIKIPEIFIQDIDNLEDWRMAEFKYNYLKSLNLI